LAEDNALNQQVASELLSDAGFHVDIAGNGQIACEMATSGEYDLILMDMQMPVMDGLTATRTLKSLPTCAGTPIVAMTANAMQSDREQCLASGMVDHLAKPIDPEELFRTLLKWIKPVRRVEPAAPANRAGEAQPLPDTIPGLDRVKGVRLVGGNASRYAAILRRFVESQAEAPEAIRLALDAADISQAELLAHTLKGLAGTIAAAELYHAASAVERVLAEGAPRETIDAALNALISRCAWQIEAIRNALPTQVGESDAGKSFDPALIADTCAQLRALLLSSSGDVGVFVESNKTVLQSAFPGQFTALRTAVEKFEMEAALEILDEAMS
jgi:CheY-like chemotaxis protein